MQIHPIEIRVLDRQRPLVKDKGGAAVRQLRLHHLQTGFRVVDRIVFIVNNTDFLALDGDRPACHILQLRRAQIRSREGDGTGVDNVGIGGRRLFKHERGAKLLSEFRQRGEIGVEVSRQSCLALDLPGVNIRIRHRTSDSDLAVPGVRALAEFQAGAAVKIDPGFTGARPISECNLGAVCGSSSDNRNVGATCDQRHVIALDAAVSLGLVGLALKVQNTLLTERHRKLAIAFAFDGLMNVQSAVLDLNIVLRAVQCTKGADFCGFGVTVCNTVDRVRLVAREASDFEGDFFRNFRPIGAGARSGIYVKGLQICVAPRNYLFAVLVSAGGVRIKQERRFSEVVVLVLAGDTAQCSRLVRQKFKILLSFDGGVLCRIDDSVNRFFLHEAIQRLSRWVIGLDFCHTADGIHLTLKRGERVLVILMERLVRAGTGRYPNESADFDVNSFCHRPKIREPLRIFNLLSG
ncbi:hypothetical protein PBR20603_04819 [Pandoraea bronchicola]|uniref:Uncharacterized protein n=1 Tax=Pandoraea bronchicola TaxID=2508287 RepID=A0A5E5BZB3_9BURK|nr:hypothetical protein PBR20603_04819 [Pandoraea bronchicola]